MLNDDRQRKLNIIAEYADVAELVDAPDLGSGAARCESSSLSVRTIFFVLFH